MHSRPVHRLMIKGTVARHPRSRKQESSEAVNDPAELGHRGAQWRFQYRLSDGFA
jgi:hypothetical protein